MTARVSRPMAAVTAVLAVAALAGGCSNRSGGGGFVGPTAGASPDLTPVVVSAPPLEHEVTLTRILRISNVTGRVQVSSNSASYPTVLVRLRPGPGSGGAGGSSGGSASGTSSSGSGGSGSSGGSSGVGSGSNSSDVAEGGSGDYEYVATNAGIAYITAVQEPQCMALQPCPAVQKLVARVTVHVKG
jgi:hypothetical protein